jgi:hypothetical protein
MDQNLIDFEEGFVPLLQAAKDRGLSYRVEQCPMPGWSPGDNFHNNIAYTPAMWIALHKISERHGVGDQFRIHYDPSHSILMGQDTRSMFQYLVDEGYAFLIAGMHVKGQVIDARGVAAWGYGGQTVQRGDWDGDHVSENPVDWLDHQLAARELLDVDVASMPLIVEHEYPAARVQDKDLLKPILAGSIDFTRHIDRAAAAMYALQHEVLAAQGIPVQGTGREAFRS